jgi:tetratricopeptide (TPR) repeat protein
VTIESQPEVGGASVVHSIPLSPLLLTTMSVHLVLAEMREKCAEYNALHELLVILDGRSGIQDDDAPGDGAVVTDQQLAELIRSHAQSTPVGHPGRAGVCEQIRCALWARAEPAGWDSQERKACTEVAFELELLHPAGDPDRHKHTYHLALLLKLHIEHGPSPANIPMWEAVVQLLKETLALQDDGHVERYKCCRCLADVLRAQHEYAVEPDLFVEAELYYREALALQTIHDSERQLTCRRLVSLLKDIHGDSLRDQAVVVYKEALAFPSSDRLGRELALAQMGAELLVLFSKTGDVSHLEESIQASRDALAMQPTEWSQQDWRRDILASALLNKYHITGRGDLQLVDEAIQLHREVLRHRLVGNLQRPVTCLALGVTLFDWFENIGDRDSLDESIQIRLEALALPEISSSDEGNLRKYLTPALLARYRLTWDKADLDTIIGLERRSLAACPPGHPDRSNVCEELSKALILRTHVTADMALVDEAVALRREMHALRPIGHPARYLSCHGLAEVLVVRSELAGADGDANLNEAIQLSREALALQPADYADEELLRSNLGLVLFQRWIQTGDHAILNESIHLHREALELRPRGHPDRNLSCMMLAGALLADSASFTIALLEESSQLLQEAMTLQHERQPQWHITCGTLAMVLLHRFALTADGTYLDEAIQLSRKVLDLRPEGNRFRWMACVNLATMLYSRLVTTDNISLDASDEMQAICDEVLQLCPPGHPSRWRCLVMHAKLSAFRNDPASAVLDLSEAMSDPYADGVPDMLTVFFGMMTIVNQRSLTPESQQILLDVYERAVDLVIITAGFTPDRSFQLKRVQGGTIIGPRALFLANQRDDLAAGLRILERARGVIWSQMLHVRDPQIDLVPAALAIQLQALLGSASTPSVQREGADILTGLGPFLTDRDVRNQQHIQLQDVLHQIRSLPGLHDYLRGPDTPSLLAAAERSVVVVLVADETESYALIIRSPKETLAVVTLAIGEEALRGLEVPSSPSQKRGAFDEHGHDDNEDHRAMTISRRLTASMASLKKLWRLVVEPVLSHLQLSVSGRVS